METPFTRPLRIVFAGTDNYSWSNVLRRCRWLEKLGHDVQYVSVALPYTRRYDVRRIRHLRRMEGPGFESVNQRLVEVCQGFRPEMVWTDKAFTIYPETLRRIKELGNPMLVAHNNDTPFIGLPKIRRTWRHFLESIPLYDAHFVTQRYQIDQFLQAGAAKVLRILSGTDPEIHYPRSLEEAAPGATNNIVFVGRPEPERIEVAEVLARRFDSRVKLYGPSWHKVRSRALKRYRCPQGIIYNETYAATLTAARVSLGFLTTFNPDFVTRRSYEIAACGGCLLTQPTIDHQRLFREGKEAFFWSDMPELLEKVQYLLEHDEVVRRVKKAAYQRSQELGFGYDRLIPRWLGFVFGDRQVGDELWEATEGEVTQADATIREEDR